jgi:hypothetical protein
VNTTTSYSFNVLSSPSVDSFLKVLLIVLFFFECVHIGMIVVTRSLGDHNMKDYLSNEPHVEAVELTSDDDLLVLACDGVWDVIQDQEAIDLIKNETAADRMSRILMVKALQVLLCFFFFFKELVC